MTNRFGAKVNQLKKEKKRYTKFEEYFTMNFVKKGKIENNTYFYQIVFEINITFKLIYKSVKFQILII